VLGAYYLSNVLFLRYPITQGAVVYQAGAVVGVPYPTGAVDLPTNGTTLISGVKYKASIALNTTEQFAGPLHVSIEIAHKCAGPAVCALDYSTIWGLSYDKIWLQAYNGTSFVSIPVTYNSTTESWQGAIYITHLPKGSTKIPILLSFYPNVPEGAFEMRFALEDLGQTPIGAPGYLW